MACAIGIVLAAAACGPIASMASAQDPAPVDGDRSDPEGPLGQDAIAARRAALASWAHEPGARDGGAFRSLMDRHDSSFSLETRRNGVRFFSSWGRRGFASVRLVDGRVLPIDRVDRLDAGTKKIRFRAASSAGEVPPVWIELRHQQELGTLVLGFEVPRESRDRVASVVLLDGAMWTTDADDGAMAAARGTGLWLRAGASTEATEDVRLRGFPLGAAPKTSDADGASAPEAYTMPVLGIVRQDTPLIAFWDDPAFEVRIARRRVDDDSFPGRDGLFASLELADVAGEVHLLCVTDVDLGPMELIRTYRTMDERRFEVRSLRYKTGAKPELRALLGAAVFRQSIMTRSAGPLAAGGDARTTFAKLEQAATHLRRDLEIDQALFVLDDWIGDASGLDESAWTAASAAGGTQGLAKLSESLRASGYLLGLAVDRDQLHAPLTGDDASRTRGWRRALEFARQDEGFTRLRDLYAPRLIVVREPTHALSATQPVDWDTLGDARRELADYAVEMFGLFGAAPASRLDVPFAAYLEGGIDDKLRSPLSRDVFPLFPACFGHATRMVTAGKALGPTDAAAFLAHLLCGEVPVYELGDGDGRDASDAALKSAGGVFARAGGWSEGKELDAQDIFIKNTYEVASHLARLRARTRLMMHRSLTDDGSVQESWFGADLRVLVNFGTEPYRDEDTKTVLPQYGFLVRHPFFRAFHAIEAGGIEYDKPAFFTVLSLEGKMFLRAESVRLYRGFGPRKIRLGGKVFEVDRELITRIW